MPFGPGTARMVPMDVLRHDFTTNTTKIAIPGAKPVPLSWEWPLFTERKIPEKIMELIGTGIDIMAENLDSSFVVTPQKENFTDDHLRRMFRARGIEAATWISRLLAVWQAEIADETMLADIRVDNAENLGMAAWHEEDGHKDAILAGLFRMRLKAGENVLALILAFDDLRKSQKKAALDGVNIKAKLRRGNAKTIVAQWIAGHARKRRFKDFAGVCEGTVNLGRAALAESTALITDLANTKSAPSVAGIEEGVITYTGRARDNLDRMEMADDIAILLASMGMKGHPAIFAAFAGVGVIKVGYLAVRTNAEGCVPVPDLVTVYRKKDGSMGEQADIAALRERAIREISLRHGVARPKIVDDFLLKGSVRVMEAMRTVFSLSS